VRGAAEFFVANIVDMQFRKSGDREKEMLKKSFVGMAALVAAGVIGVGLAGQNAQAALILDIQSGATVINDNGPGDTDLAIGRIINTTFIGGFGLAITVGTSNSPGDPTAGILQIQSLDIQNNNANQATLILKLSDTNFSMPGNATTPMKLESAVGGTFTQGAIGDNLTFQSFADPANGQPAGPVNTPALAFVRSSGAITESFAGMNSVNFARNATPYSLTNITTVALSAGGQMNVSGTTTATVVPEPAVLSLSALAGIALLTRKRK